jgi:hypothetical protein
LLLVLAIKPSYAEAQHMINSLTGKTSQSDPKEYVENLFNNYVDKFEDSLINNLEYAMPLLLKKIFLNSGLAKNNICKIVDLKGIYNRGRLLQYFFLHTNRNPQRGVGETVFNFRRQLS